MAGEQKTGRNLLLAGAGLGLALAGREVARRLREADLRGQVALITGGSRGLGYLLAREFARQGCRIAVCARDAEELDRARAALQHEGAAVLTVPCDVGDQPQVDHLLAAVTDHYGRVDLLVNNAGLIEVGPVEAMTVADFEQAMAVMFWGVLYPTLAVLPQMLARRSGRIVNVTSIGGKVSIPHLVPYSCAKFAAVALSEGLRAELAGRGVQVTTIVPGLMRTGSYLGAQFKGRQKQEFTWFSLSSSLPLITMDAERAARQIVRAAKRGEAERILSLPANALAAFHGLFPGLTDDILALVNQYVLPAPDGDTAPPVPGHEVQPQAASPLLQSLTRMGREAARRYQPPDIRGPSSAGAPRTNGSRHASL